MVNLNLEDEGNPGVVYDAKEDQEVSGDIKLCLVGRFLTDRTIRNSIMSERLVSVWGPGRG